MFSWNKPDDRVAIGQMNDELRRAQLDLLSAESSMGRLRLRFKLEDLVAYGEPNVLRKALASVSALHSFYSRLSQQAPAIASFAVSDSASVAAGAGSSGSASGASLSADKTAILVANVGEYIRNQRNAHRPNGLPLSADQQSAMSPFFSAALLAGVRVVAVPGHHRTNPLFYEEARALGFTNLPDFSYITSLTFDDVILFPGEVNDRRLFHALVHATQFRVLGLDRYAEFFARGVLRSRLQTTVPFQAQAYSLETRFAENPKKAFSVEDIVRAWLKEGRY